MNLKSKICILFLVTFVAGCAGTNFQRPVMGEFSLGKTTLEDLKGKLGEPRRTVEAVKNSETVTGLTYVFATTMQEPFEQGVVPARAQVYWFHKGSLVGEEFISSFKEDNTNFDENLFSRVAKGVTTRNQIVILLGRPSVSYRWPLVNKTSKDGIGYIYVATRREGFAQVKSTRKAMFFEFDQNDVVIDSKFESTK